ncbi:MAG TPA: hypothetical protein VFZ26_02450, partial [Gemmatimonadales bacterium]
RAALFAPWTRRGAQQSLGAATASAEAAARAVGGVLLPVGAAWAAALEADPTAPLYAGDAYHPAPAGTMLAALTIYQRLFGEDVRNLPAHLLTRVPGLGLSAGEVEALAAAAHAAAGGRPPDPATPVPADTTRSSPGSGPC